MIENTELLSMAISGYRARATEALDSAAKLQQLLDESTPAPVHIHPQRPGRPPVAKVEEPTERAPVNYQRPKRKARKWTAKARAAVAAAQRKRWAAHRAANAGKKAKKV